MAATITGPAPLACFLSGHVAVLALPVVTRAFARSFYLEHREGVHAAYNALHALCISCAPLMLSAADMAVWYSRQPWLVVLFVHVMIPVMQPVSTEMHAVLIIFRLYESHLVYARSMGGAWMPAAAYIALPMCSALLNAASLHIMRRRWEVLTHRQRQRSAALSGAATAGKPVP